MSGAGDARKAYLRTSFVRGHTVYSPAVQCLGAPLVLEERKAKFQPEKAGMPSKKPKSRKGQDAANAGRLRFSDY